MICYSNPAVTDALKSFKGGTAGGKGPGNNCGMKPSALDVSWHEVDSLLIYYGQQNPKGMFRHQCLTLLVIMCTAIPPVCAHFTSAWRCRWSSSCERPPRTAAAQRRWSAIPPLRPPSSCTLRGNKTRGFTRSPTITTAKSPSASL